MADRQAARGDLSERTEKGRVRSGWTPTEAPLRREGRRGRGVIAEIVDGATVRAVPESVVESTAEAIRSLSQRAQLAFAYAVGELVIERFYDGDLRAWRSRGRKSTSIRALAQRLEDLQAMSATTLYRCIAGYELLSRVGGVAALKHATASHVWAVLPVKDSERQIRLLMTADSRRWRVRELQERVREARGVALAKRRRRESVSEVAQRLERDARELLDRVRDAGASRRTKRQQLFASIMRARESLDAAQSLTHPKMPD